MSWKTHASRNPTLWASTVATACFIAFVCLSALATALATFIAEGHRHRSVLDNVERAMRESASLVRMLSQNTPPACDADTLLQLRRLAYQSRAIKDIGVLDHNDHLACSTVRGTLARHSADPYPDIIDNSQTPPLELRFGRAMLPTQSDPTTILMRVGRFTATLDPALVNTILDSGIDVIRAVSVPTQDAPASPAPANTATALQAGGFIVANSTYLDKHGTTTLNDTDLWSGDHRRWDWHTMGLVRSTRLQAVPFVLQRITPLRHAVAANASFNRLLALLGLAFAGITFLFTRERVRAWGGIHKRVATLLHDKQLVCRYQPIVVIETGEIIGCEVLVRLRDGDTLLNPEEFLGAVVTQGLTWRLDRAVIMCALSELSQAVPRQVQLSVAINLFPDSVRAQEVHAAVTGALGPNPHPGITVTIEVIEHAYQGTMLQEIATLKALGYAIAVDDFGTGYSNLGSVSKMAPHRLKIDRSFVHDMHSLTVRSSLIPEIVAIARAAGAEVVAEGVESEHQRQSLAALGVRFGQGYLFGKPMAIADFLTLLATHNARCEAPPHNPEPQPQSAAQTPRSPDTRDEELAIT